MMDRNLDGAYFRVERDGEHKNVCFSDLTVEERDEVTKERGVKWLRALCYHLADILKDIGEQFNIQGED